MVKLPTSRIEEISTKARDLRCHYLVNGDIDFESLCEDNSIVVLRSADFIIPSFGRFKFPDNSQFECIFFPAKGPLTRAYRQFAMGHELGHLMLGHDESFKRRVMEREADTFGYDLTEVTPLARNGGCLVDAAYNLARHPLKLARDMLDFDWDMKKLYVAKHVLKNART